VALQKLHQQLPFLHWPAGLPDRDAGRQVDPVRVAEGRDTTMSALVRGLGWPIVSLLLVGGTHFIAEAVRPELRELVSPAAVMPIYLVAGGWAGFATLRAGGTFVHGLVSGAILGLLPLVLQVVGFGMLLGRDSAAALSGGIFGLVAIFWGAALGSGVAISTEARRSVS
jgi:drug/metabolite transporter superfamily protein YnfA